MLGFRENIGIEAYSLKVIAKKHFPILFQPVQVYS